MKNNYKKRKFAILAFMVIAACVLGGWSSYRNESFDGTANITSLRTPSDIDRTGAKWYRRFSDNYYYSTSMTSTPIVTNDRVYVINADVLYELDLEGNELRTLKLAARMNSVCHPVLADKFLYIPIAGGVVVCVNTEDLSVVWISEGSIPGQPSDALSSSMGVSSGYQSLCPLFYYNGYLYSGTWKARGQSSFDTVANSEGIFYCLDAATGRTVWTYHDEESPCGFYWNSGAVYGDAIWFCAEDGRLISHALTSDKIYGQYYLGEAAELIRSGLTVDYANGILYTVTKNGRLYKISVNKSGKLLGIFGTELFAGNGSIICTCTPTLYKNRLYVGCNAKGHAYMCIRAADDLSVIADVEGKATGEIKSSPVISTYEEDNGFVQLYFTSNDSDGALYMMTDVIDENKYKNYNENNNENSVFGEERKIYQVFTPAKDRQFCIACVAVGDDGTLYYSNDSGTLFSIGEVDVSADRIEDVSISVKKPTSFKAKIIKNKKNKPTKAKLSWKNNNKADKVQTEIYIKVGKKAWSRLKTTNNKSYSFKLSFYHGKKVYVRLRSKIYSDGKTYRSGYTKKIRIKE